MSPSMGDGAPFPTGVTPSCYARLGAATPFWAEFPTAPVAPPGPPSTASVQRAAQIGRFWSSVRAMDQTWTVCRPVAGWRLR